MPGASTALSICCGLHRKKVDASISIHVKSMERGIKAQSSPLHKRYPFTIGLLWSHNSMPDMTIVCVDVLSKQQQFGDILLVPSRSNAICRGFRAKVRISVRVRMRFRVRS
jgi:hypothetical protein